MSSFSSSLYVLDTNCLSGVGLVKIFSHSVECHFVLLMLFFASQNVWISCCVIVGSYWCPGHFYIIVPHWWNHSLCLPHEAIKVWTKPQMSKLLVLTIDGLCYGLPSSIFSHINIKAFTTCKTLLKMRERWDARFNLATIAKANPHLTSFQKCLCNHFLFCFLFVFLIIITHFIGQFQTERFQPCEDSGWKPCQNTQS